jgi:hypothetical protein
LLDVAAINQDSIASRTEDWSSSIASPCETQPGNAGIAIGRC